MVEGGELFDRIVDKKFYPEDLAAVTFKNILQILNYLYENNLVHRDIKPENFLYTSNDVNAEIKLIDFGLIRFLWGGKKDILKTVAGTANYLAPEILAKNYHIGCDMWSAGTVLYTMLSGYTPFYGDTEDEIEAMVKLEKFDFDPEDWDRVSSDAKDLITKLLTKEAVRLNP